MPDFAKHHRRMTEKAVAEGTLFTVSSKLMRWSAFELSNGMPLTMPMPHCIGCLLVFDDEGAAHEHAGDGHTFLISVAPAAPREGGSE